MTCNDVRLNLIRTLCIARGTEGAWKILTNVLIAALHINFLKARAGNYSPTDLNDFDGLAIVGNNSLTVDERLYLETFEGGFKEDKTLVVPLLLALIVSPLYILLPNKLTRQGKFSKQNMIKVC